MYYCQFTQNDILETHGLGVLPCKPPATHWGKEFEDRPWDSEAQGRIELGAIGIYNWNTRQIDIGQPPMTREERAAKKLAAQEAESARKQLIKDQTDAAQKRAIDFTDTISQIRDLQGKINKNATPDNLPLIIAPILDSIVHLVDILSGVDYKFISKIN